MSHLIRFLVFLAIAVLVAGCKVAVIVVEGGEVESIGSTTCAEGTICIVEVNDTNFSELFTAVPNPGWHFVKWNSGGGFLCGDSTDPTCALSTEGAAGNAGIEAIIASDQTFYIMPVFKFGPDTVTVDGREWAQVDQFTNLSWNDINAVCPAGVCSGVLNGYDMTGWTWASVDDVNALFNHYIGNDEMGPGRSVVRVIPDLPDPPGGIDELRSAEPADPPWATDFFNDGWRATNSPKPQSFADFPSRICTGNLRRFFVLDDSEWRAALAIIRDNVFDEDSGFHSDVALTGPSGSPSFDNVYRSPTRGAWLYRSP